MSGVAVTRRLRLPAVPSAWGNPDAIVLRAVGDARQGCARVRGDVRCVTGRAVAPEEDAGFARSLELASRRAVRDADGGRPAPGGRRWPGGCFGTSRSVSSPRPPERQTPVVSVLAAVDGDARTTWTAEPDDARPSLALNWIDQRTITRLQVATDADTAAREPRRVTLDLARRLASRGSRPRRCGAVPGDPYDAAHGAGRRRRAGEQPRLRLRSLVGAYRDHGAPARWAALPPDRRAQRPPPLPLWRRAVAGSRRRAPCGPPWRQASPICTPATPREPSPAATTTCPWAPGTNLVEARASGLFRPTAVVLTDDRPLAAAPRTLVATRKDAVHRTLDPRARGGVVVLRRTPTAAGWPSRLAGPWTRWWSTDGSRAGE